MRKRNFTAVLLPVLGLLSCVLFYFCFWTASPMPRINSLSQLNDEACTLGDIEAALMQELQTEKGPSYRIGTIRFSTYAHEQSEEAASDPRLLESENFDRYQLYLAHYVAAENACIGRRIPCPFWRDMRNVTVAELEAYGMEAIWNQE